MSTFLAVKSYGKEKEIERAYSYFAKSRSYLPSYMERNLKSMPNNKGYVWKEIIFYGHMPAERNKPTVIFDKDSRTKTLTIYEWSPSEYKIFEKVGEERKKLVHREKRKQLKLT
jgi:hypothetical protein